MPDIQEAEKKVEQKIVQQEEIAKQFFVVNRKIFYLAIALVAITLGTVHFFMYKWSEKKDAEIKAYTVKMALRDADVKRRDGIIDSLGTASKNKDAALEQARDSIARAYKTLAQLNSSQFQQNEKHKKDSLTIAHATLADKIKFITGDSH